MTFKILLLVAFVLAFAGIYNMTWKTRRVPITGLDKVLFGSGFRVEEYRKANIGWVCFSCAVGCIVMAFLVH